MLTFKSKVEYYCDNIEVVHKINTLSNNHNSFNKQHETTHHDASLQLKECLPKNVIAFHVKGHQDKRKKWELFTIPERLNIQADELIGNNAKVPINNHIINTSMEIYMNGTYTPNNYVAGIRTYCGEKEAIYSQTTKTMDSKYQKIIQNQQEESYVWFQQNYGLLL